MKKKKILCECILKSVGSLVVLILVYALSYGGNFNIICDELDQTGGKSSSINFTVMLSAGGQPTPIGIGNSSNFKVMAGYVFATFVERGDVNADGTIDTADLIYLINYVYYGGPEPIPLEAGDVNCDGIIDQKDITYLQNYLYLSGPPPCDP